MKIGIYIFSPKHDNMAYNTCQLKYIGNLVVILASVKGTVCWYGSHAIMMISLAVKSLKQKV